MANKKMKWFSIATLACAASLCIGFGAANVTADAAATFAITATAVRTDAPSGLRFKVDLPVGVEKADVTNAYTTVSFTASNDQAYTTNVPATVWRTDESGWNTVLLAIPEDDYKTQVTAKAFITVNGVEYETASVETSINKTALKAIENGDATLEQVGQYVYEKITETVTFSAAGYANQQEFTTYEMDGVTITGNKGSNSNPPKYYDSGTAVRVYGGNQLTFTANNGGIITSVKLVAGTSFANDVSVDQGNFDKSKGTITEINDSAVTFTYGGTSGNVQIKGVEVTYKALPVSDAEKAEREAAKLANGVTALTKNAATATGAVDLPTVDGAEKVEWFLKEASAYASVSNNQLNVTSLPADADATLTLYAVVTAKVGDATATANTKEFTFTIVAPTVDVEKTVTKSMADMGWSNSVKYSSFALDGIITVSASTNGDNGKFYTSGNEWRLYQSNSGTMTVTAGAGRTIVSVKVTYNTKNSGVLMNGSTKVTSGTKVAVNASSITLKVGNTGTATNGQVKVTSIEVVYK